MLRNFAIIMDGMIGGDFEAGLAALRTVAGKSR
jgi:hypothetical protein